MTLSIYDDMNPDWANGSMEQPEWEPWEPEDYPDDLWPDPLACAYCGAPDVRDIPEPFGQQRCCETCFARLIGDESDDPKPFRCGNDPKWRAA